MQSRIYSVDDVQVEALIVIPERPPAISIYAKGRVNSSGWSRPELLPFVYIAPPADGILDVDFVAEAPTGVALPVISPITVSVSISVPTWLRGVRVHSSTNVQEALLGTPFNSPLDLRPPVPWPFPWWTPHAQA